jgi:hypothetical protein
MLPSVAIAQDYPIKIIRLVAKTAFLTGLKSRIHATGVNRYF